MKNLKKLSRKQLSKVSGGACTCLYCYHYNGTGNCYCGSGRCYGNKREIEMEEF